MIVFTIFYIFIIKMYIIYKSTVKMSESNEEIRYILKFYYKKIKLQRKQRKKFAMFMDLVQCLWE